MSFSFGAHCDDFHISTRLFLKLELSLERETVLHFLDSVKREYPAMRKLRRRDDGSIVLEEDEVEGVSRRWMRLDDAAIRLGYHNPARIEQAETFGRRALEKAPYHLTLGELDYDHLEVVYGFDLDYRGNHDQLVADTLYSDGPLAGLFAHESARHAIDAQPFVGVAVSDTCDTQVYVEIKSRTSTYEVRTGFYEPQPLSVYLTVRRYWGFAEDNSLLDVHHDLSVKAAEWAIDRVVPLVVNPLAQAIASRR
jgi:hypothetical protein